MSTNTITSPQFVAPVPPGLRSRLLDCNRLYAYPSEPEPPHPHGFIILDSGAFALSRSGQEMGLGWMRGLGGHYRTHSACSDFGFLHILAIAPDVYLHPYNTIANYQWWFDNIAIPVVPVIQFEKPRDLDLHIAIYQAEAYAKFKPAVVAISNPGLRAIEAAAAMPEICKAVLSITGCAWLHNLGAGWDPVDARRWLDLGFDSIDSIAYYTDARSGLAWQAGSDKKVKYVTGGLWEDLAVSNFHALLRML